MFAFRFELPERFGERVRSIRRALDDSTICEKASEQREAMRRALLEACELFREINKKTLRYSLDELFKNAPSINAIPFPPHELETFLSVERDLLARVGIHGLELDTIEVAIRELTALGTVKIRTTDEILTALGRLERMTCSRSSETIIEASGFRRRKLWYGVIGVTLVAVDLTAAPTTAATSIASVTVGAALFDAAVAEI